MNDFQQPEADLFHLCLKLDDLVKDLGRRLQKEIRFQFVGAPVDIPSEHIPELSDALTHLVRNAADHGIEFPEIRQSKGKPRFGTISLFVKQDGNAFVWELTDDGAGVDPKRVLHAAHEKGILSDEKTPESVDEAAWVKLLFVPGFSTRSKVTDISGRGIGLDAAKTSVTHLGGALEFHSEKDSGAHAIIRIPLQKAA